MINKRQLEETFELMKEEDSLDYLSLWKNESIDNYLKIWLEYKNSKNAIDLDVSLIAIVTYCKELYKFEQINWFDRIVSQKYNGKFCIQYEKGLEYRGDWLTSPLHIIKLYMGLLWENEKNNINTTKRAFVNLYDKCTNKHMLYARKGTWESYCKENAKIIWSAWDEVVKDFLKNTVSAGNFICMPIYINSSRCMAYGGDDTLDTLLWKIYCCFKLKENENELDNYINRSFNGKYTVKARLNVKEWINHFGTWENFVQYNILKKTVGKNGIPIDLRTGKEINLSIGEKFNPLPDNLNELKIMMQNYNDIVKGRTSDIFKCINSKC